MCILWWRMTSVDWSLVIWPVKTHPRYDLYSVWWDVKPLVWCECMCVVVTWPWSTFTWAADMIIFSVVQCVVWFHCDGSACWSKIVLFCCEYDNSLMKLHVSKLKSEKETSAFTSVFWGTVFFSVLHCFQVIVVLMKLPVFLWSRKFIVLILSVDFVLVSVDVMTMCNHAPTASVWSPHVPAFFGSLCFHNIQEVVPRPGTWHKNSGQVFPTYAPLSPSSISWYRPKGGDALQLGCKCRYGSCVGGR